MQIDKGVPIPPMGHGPGGGGRTTLPFRDMAVGDSVWVEKDRARWLAKAASTWKRRNPGWEHTTRLDGAGMRLWRVS